MLQCLGSSDGWSNGWSDVHSGFCDMNWILQMVKKELYLRYAKGGE